MSKTMHHFDVNPWI